MVEKIDQRRDPYFNGDWDFRPDDEAVMIDANGIGDFEIGAGVINDIYRLRAVNPSSNGYQITFYSKETRLDDDLCWQSRSIIGNYDSIDENEKLIVVTDRDRSSNIWGRITGTPADVVTLTLDLVRRI